MMEASIWYRDEAGTPDRITNMIPSGLGLGSGERLEEAARYLWDQSPDAVKIEVRHEGQTFTVCPQRLSDQEKEAFRAGYCSALLPHKITTMEVRLLSEDERLDLFKRLVSEPPTSI